MTEVFYVEIRPFTENERDPGFRCFGPMSEHRAERVEDGVNINLNHEKYYTRIRRSVVPGEETPT